jgi:hypothetical protein
MATDGAGLTPSASESGYKSFLAADLDAAPSAARHFPLSHPNPAASNAADAENICTNPRRFMMLASHFVG